MQPQKATCKRGKRDREECASGAGVALKTDLCEEERREPAKGKNRGRAITGKSDRVQERTENVDSHELSARKYPFYERGNDLLSKRKKEIYRGEQQMGRSRREKREGGKKKNFGKRKGQFAGPNHPLQRGDCQKKKFEK